MTREKKMIDGCNYDDVDVKIAIVQAVTPFYRNGRYLNKKNIPISLASKPPTRTIQTDSP